jgi:hypothetical protein
VLERDRDIEVVATCADSIEVLTAVHQQRAHVVLTDIRMPLPIAARASGCAHICVSAIPRSARAAGSRRRCCTSTRSTAELAARPAPAGTGGPEALGESSEPDEAVSSATGHRSRVCVEQRDDAQRNPCDREAPAVGDLMAGESGELTPAAADEGPEAPASPATSPTSSRRRRILVTALIWFTTLLAVVGIFAIWANRQMLNADNWANTSTKLLQDPTIESALSNYLVDQLYANVDVSGAVATRLPPRLKPLASPIAGALQNVAVSAVGRVLAAPRTQDVWRAVNRAAVRNLVAVIDGKRGNVS